MAELERVPSTCCVVGGGPAGVMAGVLLARAGVETVVLETHADFFRDFRGDTIHPSTMDVLDELGWFEAFLKVPHQRVERLGAHVGDTALSIADFSHSPTRAKFIALMPQWDFLSFLTEQARAFPRFSIRMGTEATDLVRDRNRVRGVRAKTASGELEVRADLVIAADGRHSVLRDRAGLAVRDLGAPIDVLWFRISRRKDDPPDTLGWVDRGRFLAVINRGDYWQIAFVIPKGGAERVKAAGILAFRTALAQTLAFLGERVEELRSFDDVKLLVVKVDRLERWWQPGLLCIGDAAHAMSPIGGVGINLAIQDAVATANLLAGPLEQGRLSDRDLARVQRRREFPTRATQAAQVQIQKRVIEPLLTNPGPLRVSPVVARIAAVPWLRRLPAYLVGVGVRPEHVHSPNHPGRV